MFITPAFEVWSDPNAKFLSLQYSKKSSALATTDKDVKEINEYKYLDGKEIKSVKMPAKIFNRLVLATLSNGDVLFIDENGIAGREKIIHGK